jgi:hypothetical protein
MLDSLPSGKGYFRNIPVSEADALGIFQSGDEINGLAVYKFLSGEGDMFTYVQKGRTLLPLRKASLVPCGWRR